MGLFIVYNLMLLLLFTQMGVLDQIRTIQNQNASQRQFLGEKLHQNQHNQPLCLLLLLKMYGYQILCLVAENWREII